MTWNLSSFSAGDFSLDLAGLFCLLFSLFSNLMVLTLFSASEELSFSGFGLGELSGFAESSLLSFELVID